MTCGARDTTSTGHAARQAGAGYRARVIILGASASSRWSACRWESWDGQVRSACYASHKYQNANTDMYGVNQAVRWRTRRQSASAASKMPVISAMRRVSESVEVIRRNTTIQTGTGDGARVRGCERELRGWFPGWARAVDVQLRMMRVRPGSSLTRLSLLRRR